MGERCWGVKLLTSDGIAILQSTVPLRKGDANDTAKILKFRVPDTLSVMDPLRDHGITWKLDRDGGKWLLEFSGVSATLFELLLIDILRGADVKWNPPDADPAQREKEQELTPAELDGS